MSKISKNRQQEAVRLGIDTSKKVFHLHGVNAKEQVVVKKMVSRNKLLKTIAQLPPCLIGIEACGGSHHWARTFEKYDHTVKLMPARHVKAYLKNNKNDYRDAEAICEAVSRPTMHFVPVKNLRQQDIQALHRVRTEIKKSRTALANQIRGLLAEYGLVFPRGVNTLKKELPFILEEAENGLTPLFRELLLELKDALNALEQRLTSINHKIEETAKEDEIPQLIETIPGVGSLTASAMYAAIGNADTFKYGRNVAAFLGLVPRQHSTGGKTVLLGISKKGNRYLRSLLVGGARSVVQHSKGKTDPYSLWIQGLVARGGFNKATVAVANKNARMAFAILKNRKAYVAPLAA